MQIRFLPAAEAELAEARIWYGLQRDGLDDYSHPQMTSITQNQNARTQLLDHAEEGSPNKISVEQDVEAVDSRR